MCKNQKTDIVSINYAVSYAKRKVAEMPSWKTGGFDQRSPIVMKAPSASKEKDTEIK